MTEAISLHKYYLGGNVAHDCQGEGEFYGHGQDFHFPPVASVGAGAALTTIQGRLWVPFRHRLKAAVAGAKTATAVSAGTDPAIDIRRHMPIPATPTLTLGSAAGDTTNGTRYVAVTFTNAAGDSMPSAPAAITITDKDVVGKFTVSLPIGPSGCTGRKVWSTDAGGSALKLAYTIANNTATSQEYNLADGSLGAAAPTASTAVATVLSATIKLSNTYRSLADQPVAGVLADGVDALKWDPCMYDLRALTGASTGALADLLAHIRVERVTETD